MPHVGPCALPGVLTLPSQGLASWPTGFRHCERVGPTGVQGDSQQCCQIAKLGTARHLPCTSKPGQCIVSQRPCVVRHARAVTISAHGPIAKKSSFPGTCGMLFLGNKHPTSTAREIVRCIRAECDDQVHNKCTDQPECHTISAL